MDGYLEQIASRGNAVFPGNEGNSFSYPTQAAASTISDPFENESRPINPQVPDNKSIPATNQKLMPESIKGQQPKMQDQVKKMQVPDHHIQTGIQAPIQEPGYIFRHVIRQEVVKKQEYIPAIQSTILNIPAIHTGEVSPKENQFTKPAFSNAEDPGSKIKNEIKQQTIVPKETIVMAEIKPSTTVKVPAEKNTVRESNQSNNEISLVMPASKTEKQVAPSSVAVQSPKLVIGRITVEILPAAKPQVINKIERKVITETRTVADTSHQKFIFGLGQL